METPEPTPKQVRGRNLQRSVVMLLPVVDTLPDHHESMVILVVTVDHGKLLHSSFHSW